ncbi:MAG TPA: hypothetical protein VMT09_14885 [Steroidobacteraceae bacterium]|nr:hypothetical protein [Steroidobacteraceae bacterium]
MKLAQVSAAAERQGRRERLQRDRAAALALREAYPGVLQLRLELLFQGSTLNNPAPQSHTLHTPARAFFEFPCPYADCDGHFDLGAAVKTAVCDPMRRAAGELRCSGTRVVRVGGKEPCQLLLGYTVTATFEADA